MAVKKSVVIYGSQTGQSKSVAENIVSVASEKNISLDLMSMEESLSQAPWSNYDIVIIVTSSTGDGDPPDNAISFWRKLRSKDLASKTLLSHLRFALLGLGDTNYSTFCGFPKAVERKLLDLGAKKFYRSGFADDAVGLETVVEPWIDELFLSLDKALNNTDFFLPSEPTGVIADLPPAATEMEQSAVKEEIPELEPVNEIDLPPSETLNIELIRNPNPLLKDIDLKVPVCPQPFLHIIYQSENPDLSLNKMIRQNNSAHVSAASPVVKVPVASSRILTHPEAVKTAIEIKLDLKEAGFDYQPGDSFAVICPNPESEVETLLQKLNLLDRADVPVTLEVDKELAEIKIGTKNKFQVPSHLPQRATLRYYLLHCCEIRSVPKKAFLRVMAEYTSSPADQRRLLELSSIQGSDDYTKLIREPNLNIIDLLQHFPTCCLPVERLLEHLPRLAPRPYSFSSSPLTEKSSGTFVFNVVEFPANLGRDYQRKGIATGWLQNLVSANQRSLEERIANINLNEIKIPIYLRTGTSFRLPEDYSIPIIMVGPGTGVAPFVGFMQQREHLIKNNPDANFGSSWLFFGCRRRDRDYLYKEELGRLFNVGVLNRLLVSFSRENLPGKPKYVQDLIKQHENQLVRLMDKGARIYVCGDAANMSKDVMAAFITAVKNEKNIPEQDATKYVLEMMKEKRYLQDIWA